VCVCGVCVCVCGVCVYVCGVCVCVWCVFVCVCVVYVCVCTVCVCVVCVWCVCMWYVCVCGVWCVCLCVALGTYCKMRRRHIAICGLHGCNTFFHIVSWTARFFKTRDCTQNVCFDFLYNIVWNISHSKKNWALYDKNLYWSSTRYYCQIFMKLECSRQIFEKHSNIKFNENLSIGRRVVPCGHTDRQIWRS